MLVVVVWAVLMVLLVAVWIARPFERLGLPPGITAGALYIATVAAFFWPWARRRCLRVVARRRRRARQREPPKNSR